MAGPLVAALGLACLPLARSLHSANVDFPARLDLPKRGNEPRTAYCLTGSVRSLIYPLVYESVRINLTGDSDIFVVLYTGYDENPTLPGKVSPDDLERALDFLQPVSAKFITRPYEAFCGNPSAGQLRGWATCPELIEAYEAESGMRYDLVVRTRPDILWTREISWPRLAQDQGIMKNPAKVINVVDQTQVIHRDYLNVLSEFNNIKCYEKCRSGWFKEPNENGTGGTRMPDHHSFNELCLMQEHLKEYGQDVEIEPLNWLDMNSEYRKTHPQNYAGILARSKEHMKNPLAACTAKLKENIRYKKESPKTAVQCTQNLRPNMPNSSFTCEKCIDSFLTTDTIQFRRRSLESLDACSKDLLPELLAAPKAGKAWYNFSAGESSTWAKQDSCSDDPALCRGRGFGCPRVAVMMVGSVQSLTRAHVYRSFKRNVLEAFGGRPRLFMYLARQDKEDPLWDTSIFELEKTLVELRPTKALVVEELDPAPMQTALDMILEYESQNSAKFDSVLLVRPHGLWYASMPPHCAINPASRSYRSIDGTAVLMARGIIGKLMKSQWPETLATSAIHLPVIRERRTRAENKSQAACQASYIHHHHTHLGNAENETDSALNIACQDIAYRENWMDVAAMGAYLQISHAYMSAMCHLHDAS